MPETQGNAGGSLLGTWKLQSFITEHLVTGEKTTLFGTHPVGYLSCSAGGCMYALFAARGSKAIADLVPTDAESVHL